MRDSGGRGGAGDGRLSSFPSCYLQIRGHGLRRVPRQDVSDHVDLGGHGAGPGMERESGVVVSEKEKREREEVGKGKTPFPLISPLKRKVAVEDVR